MPTNTISGMVRPAGNGSPVATMLVQRRTYAADGVTVAVPYAIIAAPGLVTSYADSTPTSGVKYGYRYGARNRIGDSGYSPETTVVTASAATAADDTATVNFATVAQATAATHLGVCSSTYGNLPTVSTAQATAERAIDARFARIPVRWNGTQVVTSAGGSTFTDILGLVNLYRSWGWRIIIVIAGRTGDWAGYVNGDAAAIKGVLGTANIDYSSPNEPDNVGVPEAEIIARSQQIASEIAPTKLWGWVGVSPKRAQNKRWAEALGAARFDGVDYHHYGMGSSYETTATAFAATSGFATAVADTRTDLAGLGLPERVNVDELNFSWRWADGTPDAEGGSYGRTRDWDQEMGQRNMRFFTGINTVWMASALMHVLRAGGRGMPYATQNGPLGLTAEANPSVQNPDNRPVASPMPAYWAVAMITGGGAPGAARLFPHFDDSFYPTTTSNALTEVFAVNNEAGGYNITVINKRENAARTVRVDLSGLPTGTYVRWLTRKTNPYDAPVASAVTAYAGSITVPMGPCSVATLVLTPSASSTPAAGATFADDFDTLDDATWHRNYPYALAGAADEGAGAPGSWNAGTAPIGGVNYVSMYALNDDTANGGRALELAARRTAEIGNGSGSGAGGKAWVGGILISKADFTYGYFEVRAKLPVKGKGMFPALWLFGSVTSHNDYNHDRAEIDLLEVFGNATGQPWTGTLHAKNGDGTKSTAAPAAVPANGQIPVLSRTEDTAAWHVYGVDWQADRLRYYRDGVEIANMDAYAAFYAGLRMQIRLNYAMDGSFFAAGNFSDATTPSTLRMRVDYVRRYATRPGAVAPAALDYVTTPIPASPVLDANSAARVSTALVGGSAGQQALLNLSFASLYTVNTSHPVVTVVATADPNWLIGGTAGLLPTWAPFRLPPGAAGGGIDQSEDGDHWLCLRDPSRTSAQAPYGIQVDLWRFRWRSSTSYECASITVWALDADGKQSFTRLAGTGTGAGLGMQGLLTVADVTGTGEIPHAIYCGASNSFMDTGVMEPATKTGGAQTPSATTVREAMRLQLNPAVSLETAGLNAGTKFATFQKRLARALQVHGGYLSDTFGPSATPRMNIWAFSQDPTDLRDANPTSAQPWGFPGDPLRAAGAGLAGNPAGVYLDYIRYDYDSLPDIPWRTGTTPNVRLLASWNPASTGGGGTGGTPTGAATATSYATVVRSATSTGSTGAWTNTANALGSVTNDATWTSGLESLGTGTLALGFDLSAVPAGATITSVTAEITHSVSSASNQLASLFSWHADDATQLGATTTLGLVVTATTETVTLPVAVTAAHLRSGTFHVRFIGRHTTSTVSSQRSLLDKVLVTVNYTT